MNKKIRTDAVDHLFQAILTLETPEECYAFFEDVCTVNELLSLSQRYEVAKMLREKRTYLDIAEKDRCIHSDYQSGQSFSQLMGVTDTIWYLPGCPRMKAEIEWKCPCTFYYSRCRGMAFCVIQKATVFFCCPAGRDPPAARQ